MKKATFDPARNLDLYFRIGMNGTKTLNFKDSAGDPFDLSGQEFEFRSGFDVALTVGASSITLDFAEDEVIKRDVQFWSLVNTTTGQTWLCGNAIFTGTQANEITDSDEIIINLDGDDVEVTIESVIGTGGSYQGDWDPTGDVLPTDALQGQAWRLTSPYNGWIGRIEAAIDDPQDDDDWNFINLTTF